MQMQPGMQMQPDMQMQPGMQMQPDMQMQQKNVEEMQNMDEIEYEIQDNRTFLRKVWDDIKLPLLVFLLILFFTSNFSTKTIISYIPMFANEYKKMTLTGNFFKSFIGMILFYLIARFVLPRF